MTVTLRQMQATPQRLDCRGLLPSALEKMNEREIGGISLRSGNRLTPLGELFNVTCDTEDAGTLVVHPIDDRLDFLGTGLHAGQIIVEGDAGDYAGREMKDGNLTVRGNVGDLAGSGLQGGTLLIHGNAGRQVGAPTAGKRQGQRGGVIRVRGDVGERAGERMRRGIIIVEGNAGAFLGYRMIAGTIFVAGQAGERAGYGMHRGTLLLQRAPETICPTLRPNGRHDLAFLRLLLDELHHLSGEAILNRDDVPEVERYVGDIANDGRGEILILC
jgi:formylmethanofuran dehydrogenase subunit C